MLKKDGNNKLDVNKINSTVSLFNKILKIGYLLIIVVAIYAFTLIIKEWSIVGFLKTVLKILTPFFIGIIIAWLFNPFVTWLQKKKVNRILGTTIVYILFLGLIYFFVYNIIPMIASQATDVANSIPEIIDVVSDKTNDIFDGLKSNNLIDYDKIKEQILDSLNEVGGNIVSGLPTLLMNMVKSFISALGTFGIGLLIGFYMLLNFNNVSKTLLSFLPKKIRNTAEDLFITMNSTLFNYVKGILTVAFFIFIADYIGFLILGVDASLLFAAFCGITDIIPYVGPYIGGIPVALMSLTQSTTTGILVIIYIVMIQLLESMVLQPLIMSKTMKLNPVTILIGLLVFGHFFGIIGMIFATPCIALVKSIIIFYDKKYHFTNYRKE